MLKSELREQLLAEIRGDLRVNAAEKDLPLSEQTETRARNLLDPRNTHPDTPDAVTIRNLVLGEDALNMFRIKLVSTWVPRVAAGLRARLNSQYMRLFLMANLTTGHHDYLFQMVTAVIHEVETLLAPEFALAATEEAPDQGGGMRPHRLARRQKPGLLGVEGQRKSLKALRMWLRLTHFPLVEGHRPLRSSRVGPLVPQGQEGAD